MCPQSLQVRTRHPARVAQAVERALEHMPRARGGAVFVTGALANQPLDVARELAKIGGELPFIVAPGAGVISDQGELEDDTAAAVLLWSGGEPDVVSVNSESPEQLCARLSDALEARSKARDVGALVLMHPRGITPEALEPLRALRRTRVFGGGTVGDSGVALVDAGGACSEAMAGALVFRGMPPPVVRSSPACRLLMPFRKITEARDGMVFRVDGQSVLSVLNSVASDLDSQPLVLVALAEASDVTDAENRRPALVLRPVLGVDPAREGLLVSAEARPGSFLAFAIRDGNAAREDLDAVTRELARSVAGAAPRFGFYITCAGRGRSLYGSPDVDVRVLRSRFPDLPWAGLASAFELSDIGSGPALQLYTGVFALFTAPS